MHIKKFDLIATCPVHKFRCNSGYKILKFDTIIWEIFNKSKTLDHQADALYVLSKVIFGWSQRSFFYKLNVNFAPST